MNVILIGAQGSGKGTQATRLGDLLRLQPCASGELLRKAIAAGTPLGRRAQPYYDNGDLVPDEIIIGMVLESIDQRGDAHGIILDGFPRTIAQARALDDSLTRHGTGIDRVISLEVPREMLLDRLTGRYLCRAAEHVWNIKTNPPRVPGICDFDGSELYQRNDDTGEKIQRRLDIFFTETVRLTDYYAAQGKLLRVDGTGGIDAVTRAIMDGITSAQSTRAIG
ncbi:MAG TPA: adenylate kinase [Ktedonobacterales bacterium]